MKTIVVRYTCDQCGEQGEYALPDRVPPHSVARYAASLPDGWSEHGGRQLCPRHRLVIEVRDAEEEAGGTTGEPADLVSQGDEAEVVE